MKNILYTLSILVCFLAGSAIQAQTCNAPIISSFAPNTGYIGSTVTISGANFSSIPANNQVFFGATQATVLTASFGTLTVTVPVGATTAPIAVKNNCNLIAYSAVSFNGIFCPTPITSTTYNNYFELKGVYGAYNMLAQDMDLDGKPDIVTSYPGSGVTVARNTSTPGNFSFTANNFSGGGSFVSTADFDGDGKRDLFTTAYILRNTSTGPGNINFQVISTGYSGYQSNVGDFNNDGKIDIVYENAGGTMYFYRNTSTGPGNISFALAATVSVNYRSTGIQCVDADGDGKVDLLSTQGDGNRLIALRNTTTPGATTFTFAALQSFSTGGIYPYRCQIADFDKDGKIDLTTVNFNSSANTVNTAVLRNISTIGNINFAAANTYSGPVNNYRVGVGDVNGDGYPDIVTKSLAVLPFAVYPNTSTGPGNISFANRFDYSSAAAAEVSGIVIGDLDGDYVPDIATSGINSNTIRFHRNTSAQVDVTPPTALCKNIIAALSPSGNVTVTAAMIDNGSSDACGIGSILINNSPSVTFNCSNIGPNTVTLKVIDRAGNESTCTSTVTVAAAAIIVTGQTTVCQGQTVLLNANQGDSYQWKNNGVDIPGATNQTYTATISGNYTVTVINGGGCSGTSSPTAVTVNNNPTVNTTPSGNVSLCPPANNLVIGASTSSLYQWKLNGTNINGATQQNYTATTAGSYSVQVVDLFGCSATSSAVVVNATDNIPPTAICKNATVVINANGTASITSADIDNNSYDNCSTITVSISAGKTDYTCADAGQTFPVTLLVRDAQGLTSSCIAQVSVTDPNSVCNHTPVAVCKAVTVSANGNCEGTASASAFDGGSTDADAGDVLTFSVFPAGPYAKGTTSVTFTVTDQKGASSSCSTTITVVDNQPPTLTGVPADVTVECNAIPAAAEVTASDNCSATLSFNETTTAGSCPGNYTITRTWTAIDPSLNTTSATQIITVHDTQAPVLSAKPADVTVECDAIPVAANITATDNCGPNPEVVFTETRTDGTSPNDYILTRIWTATDACNNAASWTQLVTVKDTKAPTLTVPDNINVNNDQGVCGATISFEATAKDNCSPVTISYSTNPGTVFSVGTTLVTVTAKDLSGNTTVGSFTVTVTDNEKPTITAPANISVNSEPDICGASVKLGDATTNDNCKVESITNNAPAVFPLGTTTVTWTVKDIHGNTNTAAQTVTVTDKTPPVIMGCPGTISVLTGAGRTTCDQVATWVAPTATDNCGSVTVSSNYNSGDVFPVGTTVVTYTFTDAHSNTSTCSFNVTVSDNTSPAVSGCPGNITVVTGAGRTTCDQVATWVAPTATDNCGTVTVSSNHNSGEVFPVGTTAVTYTFTDARGNTSTCSFNVTIIDNTPPVASCKPVTVTLVNGVASVTAADVNSVSSDNCGPVTIALSSASKTSYTCADGGKTFPVTLIVTDSHNNTSTCIAQVTVTGEIPTCSIASIPTNTTFTGGNPLNLYLGYGAQSTTLKVTPAANGAPYTYSWSGPVSLLSSSTSIAPVFTPTVAGQYAFTVTTTNKYGCATTCSIIICVTDIRVPGTNGSKVYVCHLPPGNPGNPNTLSISVNAVPAHLGNHAGDRLGSCDQTPCSAGPVTHASTKTSQIAIKEQQESNDNEAFTVVVSPNPSATYFTLKLESKNQTPVSMKVMDAHGRVIDAASKIAPNSSIQIGHNYISGSYYAEMTQGNTRKVVQLIKVK